MRTPIKTRLLALILLTLSLTTRAAEDTPEVVMHTSEGDIVITLDPVRAPLSVENFLQYVDRGFYNGTLFHRVIPGFMIQGGGLDQDLNTKPTARPVRNESANGLGNRRGSLAMARTQNPDSATSQFFINLTDNTYLNGGLRGSGYTVFGQVSAGMDIVDSIARTPTRRQGRHQNLPVTPVIIESIERR